MALSDNLIKLDSNVVSGLKPGQRMVQIDGVWMPVGIGSKDIPLNVSGGFGDGTSDVVYGYINDDGMFQPMDLSGDIITETGEPEVVEQVGVFKVGIPFRMTAVSANTDIYLSSLSNNQITTLYYRTNVDPEWKQLQYSGEVNADGRFLSNPIMLNVPGDYVEFHNTVPVFSSHRFIIGSDGMCDVSFSGNIHSLLNYGDLHDSCFYGLFSHNSGLTSAPQLPADRLATGCYSSMFDGCEGLITAPDLPATQLAEHCYSYMFLGCTSLINAPVLLAEKIETGSYQNMFRRCDSLEYPPYIGAHEVAPYCCEYMFMDCKSLKYTPQLISKTLAVGCYRGMFSGCSSLTGVSNMYAESLAEDCCAAMYSDCTAITGVTLPAATPNSRDCYADMFNGCSKLRKISVGFSSWGDVLGTARWVAGVAAVGEFNKPYTLMEAYSVSNIPIGWKVIEE